jgi:hypothetical protein
MKLRSNIHNKNIGNKGNVSKSLRNKEDKSVSALVLGIFIFVVVGSAVF